MEEMQDSENEICCLKCKYFEPRSGFCRKNPPTPIAVIEKYGSHLMSAFPKIPMPSVDFCYQFVDIN